MIVIEENLPQKIPGLTTLFIKPSNATDDIVKSIEETSEVFSHPKRSDYWEVPITSLSSLLDVLTGYDDIDLIALQDTKDEEEDIVLDTYKTKPFKHQINAIKYGLRHDSWLLLDDPGLGKTLSICYLAQELKKRGAEHCLIVCGINTLKTNWKKEINKHTDISCKILGSRVNRKGKLVFGSIKDRINDLNNKIDEFFVITNIESLRSDEITKLIEYGVNKFDFVALDEAHCCKDSSSKQGSNLMKLKSMKRRVGMSGTLFINDPVDLYTPLNWIGAYSTTVANFKKYFYKYGGIDGQTIVGFKNLDVLNRDLQKVSLRRTIEDEEVNVEIPEKTIIEEFVDMNESQRKFYEDIKRGVIDEVDKVKMNKKSVLGLVTRLRQATVLPSILTTSNIESSKIERAIELTEELLSKGEKVVIFSQYKEPVYEIGRRLSKYRPLINTGDIKDEVVSENMHRFQNDDSCKLFIATSDKCGTGIDLFAARYLIFLDTPWTDSQTSQCEDRIHRIGAKEKMFIYRLITTDTIDEKVEETIKRKKVLSDYIVDGEVSQDLYELALRYIDELR